MKQLLPSLLLILACATPRAPEAPSTPPPPKYGVHDLTPTFWAFWDEAKDLPSEEQARLFRERVVAKHPDVYTPQVLSLDPDAFEQQLDLRWPRFMKFAGASLPLARKLSESIHADLPRYDAAFRKAFPDFNFDGDVFFMVSGGSFDGATRQVKDRTALLFGVDVIAAVYGTDADPKAFFDHELFHIYHQQQSDPALDGTLAEALWEEGLAVYVADQLNPGTPELVLFGLPRTSPAEVRAQLPQLAARMKSELGSRSHDDYKRWFMGNNAGQETPARGGYTLGYLTVKELARGRDLLTLAKLRGPELRAELDAALARLAGEAR